MCLQQTQVCIRCKDFSETFCQFIICIKSSTKCLSSAAFIYFGQIIFYLLCFIQLIALPFHFYHYSIYFCFDIYKFVSPLNHLYNHPLEFRYKNQENKYINKQPNKQQLIQFIMITFTEILGCDGTALYTISENKLTFVSSGRLSVLLAYDGMILLQLNQFQYGVNQDSQILYDNQDPQFSYIFYLKRYPLGQWIIKLNQNGDSVFSCLNQKCYMKNKRQPQKLIQETCKMQKKTKIQIQQVKVKKVQKSKQSKEQQEKQDSSILVDASKQIGKGLIFTGKLLSKGFESLGGFISRKVQPEKNVKISESTKENINLAKKTTKNVLTFTAEQVSALFKFGKQVAKDAGQTFQKSQKGKQFQKHEYYDTAKQGAKTGAKVLANLYDGVVNAVYEIGSGVGKGTTKVVGAKYGKDAEQATDGVFQGVGNVAKIVRIPKDELAKQLKQ